PVKELRVRPRAAVRLCTHDFGAVAEIAARIVVMNQGDLVEAGTRDDILARPQQSYTRRLVPSVPSLVPLRRDAPDGATVLSVHGLGRVYTDKRPFWSGGKRAVLAADDVNLTLRKGEILGIVGESGSGK